MNAKQTAMTAYGFTSWPPSHVHTPDAASCRGLACKLMRDSGMLLKVIAYEVGFCDRHAVGWAIKRLERENH